MRVKKSCTQTGEYKYLLVVCPWPFEQTNGPTKRGRKLPKRPKGPWQPSTRARLYGATYYIILALEVSNL